MHMHQVNHVINYGFNDSDNVTSAKGTMYHNVVQRNPNSFIAAMNNINTYHGLNTLTSTISETMWNNGDCRNIQPLLPRILQPLMICLVYRK